MVSFTRLFSCLVFLLITLATPAMPEVQPHPGDVSIQDEANLLSPPVKNDLATMIASDSRAIRLVIVPDRKEFGASGSFTEYVDALAQGWGINKRPLAILVVHEVISRKITVRLGNGYTRPERRLAHALINQIYQSNFHFLRYNAAHSKGLAALIEQLPKVITPSRINPSDYIPLDDNGSLIQDHVGTFVPNEIDAFALKLAARIHKGQMVRLVIIQRHQDLSDDKLVGAFATKLFVQWGMSDLRNSVMVLYEAQTNKVVMRHGYEFAPMVRKRAFEALKDDYKPLLRQHKFNLAHQSGMLAVLEVLGKQPEPLSANSPAQGTATEPSAPPAPVTAPTTSLPIPLNALLALMAIIAIIVIALLMSYRKSTASRRERAGRISAWKQINKVQKKRS